MRRFDPRYRELRGGIRGGFWSVAIGLFLVAGGMTLFGFDDSFFANFHAFARWIGWFFVAVGALAIARSVVGLVRADREARAARKAAAAEKVAAKLRAMSSIIRGQWFFFSARSCFSASTT
jgi:uncharacterized membrane protein YcjF (UPF0283 family)